MSARDFNLPSITWEEGLGSLISTPAYGQELNSLFIETMNEFGFEQFVNQPTRENHMLDLVHNLICDRACENQPCSHVKIP